MTIGRLSSPSVLKEPEKTFLRCKKLSRKTLRRIRRATFISVLSGSVVLGGQPANAFFIPPVYITPAVATTVAAETGVAASMLTGAGELAIVGLGAYFAYSQVQQHFHIKIPWQICGVVCSFMRPKSVATSGGDITSTYNPVTPTSLGGSASIWKDMSLVWSAYTYTLVGGASYSGVQPIWSNGQNPATWTSKSTGSAGLLCGIAYQTVATGVVAYYANEADAFDSTLVPFHTANNANYSDSHCPSGIQHSITAAGVDNVTKRLLGVYVFGYNGTDNGWSNHYATAAYINQVGIVNHTIETAVTQTLQASVTCKNAGGSTVTVTGTSVNYTQADAGSSTGSDVPIPVCPNGYYIFDSKVIQGDGITTSVPYEVGQNTGAAGTYPLCAGINQCELQVRYKTVPCTNDLSACTDWYKDAFVTPADYTCYWGTYSVPINNCNPLMYQYDPLGVPGDNGLVTKPVTITPPNTTTAPNTNDSSSPSYVHTTGGYLGCAPSGWNLLNPFAYVGMQGCLLQWLFIPDTATEFNAATTAVTTAWNSSSVGTFVNAVIAVPAAIAPMAGSSATGCAGPTVTIPWGGIIADSVIHPLDACSPPMSTVAATSKLILTIVTIVGGVFLVYNPIASALGFQRVKIGASESGDA